MSTHCHTVFLVIDSLAPGGAERLVTHLALHLNRERFQPVCVVVDPFVGSHYEQEIQQAGIPLHSLGKQRPYDPKVYQRLSHLIRHYRPSVIHSHLGDLNYTLPMMILHRIPARVYTLHNIAEKTLHHRRSGRLLQTLAFRYRLGGVQLVAIAHEVHQTAERLFGQGDIPLIPNGIPVEAFRPDPPRRAEWRQQHGFGSDEVLLVCVAGFREQKNHSLLLRAFARLQASLARLLLVGGGELEEATRHLARQLGIQERVHFLGVRPDIPEILNASDAFVMASRWEGNPMAVMEAMASGLPIIATAVGGVPELVRHDIDGLLVPSEDEAGLADALQRIVADPTLRAQMGHSAQQRAKTEFDIHQTVRKYESLYESLLARHSRR